MADSEHEYRKVVRQVAAAREATIVRLTRENEALRKALQELLQSAGWHNYTNEELRHEEELGNGKAPILLRARAAIALKEPGQ